MYLFFSMIEGRQSDPSISVASATGMGYSNSLRVQPVVTPLRVMNALLPEIRMRTVLSLSIEMYPCL